MTLIVVGAWIMMPSCDNIAPPPTSPPPPAQPSPAWLELGSHTVADVHDQAIQNELEAASRQARASVDQARSNWAASNREDRARWAVKWAAPLADDFLGQRVEHVWAQPLNWSAFRIEGVLISAPQQPLACSKSQGELVSFPIEELSDWMHLLTDDPNGPREGGFTQAVLEKHFGTSSQKGRSG